MQRLIELIFGLQRGFLSREGDFGLTFNPAWPGQSFVGVATWNFFLALLAIALVLWVYRREAHTRAARVLLGSMRALLLGLVILLLNRPILTLTQTHNEPSILPILIDDSLSMRVRDALPVDTDTSRLEAAVRLLDRDNAALVGELSKTHAIRFYRFDRSANGLAPATQPAAALAELKPTGDATDVGTSIRSALDDLQGQHLAGLVLMTDGRDAPAQPLTGTLNALQEAGVKVYPVAIGADKQPGNVSIQSVSAQDSAFKGDIANVRVQVRGSGYEPGETVMLTLRDKKTGTPMTDPSGKPVQTLVTLQGDQATDAELQFKPTQVGELDLLVDAAKQPGEVDEDDNSREIQMSILDAKLNVLYVDGYPRWEYRYLKTEMIRDASVDISCLLTSADPTFAQEGDRPITRFPESIEELLDYDVVVFGDVDPRQFSDSQLQLVSDFVSKRGGGFGMVGGPRFAPVAYRGTAIEPMLPVNISRVKADDGSAITQGFRPSVTAAGADSSIFRFFPDRAENDSYLKNALQPVFWYCRGITVKPGVGEVYAEHPNDLGPDGRKAPILVMGRFGAGRTLFSAIDDSWRWRYQSGESVFDIYWVQQLRQLARSRKLGQRHFALAADRPIVNLGEQVRVTLRVIDPQLLAQLPTQIRVNVKDSTGRVVRQETMRRDEATADTFSISYASDAVGKFTVELPPIIGGDALSTPVEVAIPRLELSTPTIDREAMRQIASQTGGQLLDLDSAKAALLAIPSAAKTIPVETSQPLWDAPLVLVLFVLLITTEWVMRKRYGML